MGKHFTINKFGIYSVDLPVQSITKFDDHDDPITTTGCEIHGYRPCVVLSVEEDGRTAIVAPLTSAQDSKGGEKFQATKKSWIRVFHEQRPSYVCLDQIRSCDRGRFDRTEKLLGEYDRKQVESRLKFVFGIV